MAESFRDLLLGAFSGRPELYEAVTPARTFDDVVLPADTRRALDQALALIRHRRLILEEWGLGERHASGLGLAFNFAGPPGTGKTLCAEAVAHALGRPLLAVRYSEMDSRWAGETVKHVASVFAAAARQQAVLFFDEADAIASRRFASVTHAYEREANIVVNVLLRELEAFDGVTIFATNLAANMDPAFERRIQTHILFTMPDAEERKAIWRLQVHPDRTPLAPDVDFAALAAAFPASGGQIRNAVFKAAQMAAAGPGPDRDKHITQAHLRAAMEDVVAAERVMRQSLYTPEGLPAGLAPLLRRPGEASIVLAGIALALALLALVLAVVI
jgi:SpoVK/Ycf46/Vps4 family AAA+-type ATPase